MESFRILQHEKFDAPHVNCMLVASGDPELQLQSWRPQVEIPKLYVPCCCQARSFKETGAWLWIRICWSALTLLDNVNFDMYEVLVCSHTFLQAAAREQIALLLCKHAAACVSRHSSIRWTSFQEYQRRHPELLASTNEEDEAR